MKALVLAAGHGERLRPITDTIPKPLLEIGGRPLIHYPLLLLRQVGIREVAVNVHHLAGKIEAALGGGEALGLAIKYSPEPVLLGSGGPLYSLRSYFDGEPFLILNGDTIMDLDLPAMIAMHRERGAIATMALRKTASLDAYSDIEIDTNGQIRRMRLLVDRARHKFEEYPAVIAEDAAAGLTALMYCGAMICQPSVLDMVPDTPPFSLVADVLAPMISEGPPLFGYLHQGLFRTVDDLKSYEQLRAEFEVAPPPLNFIRRPTLQ
jgi:NDP-sugar pyrophosphorylase family protein